MLNARNNTYFNSTSLSYNRRERTNITGGYFERSQKRSPYERSALYASAGSRRKTSVGFTVLAVLLLFLVYPVGLVMIWNKRVAFTPGTKLLFTILATVCFVMLLVYVANVETGNPQEKRVQNGLNSVFDWIYNAFGGFFHKIGEWTGLGDGKAGEKLSGIWNGIKPNVAQTAVNLLGDKADSAAYVKHEMPSKLLGVFKKLVSYEEPVAVAAVKPASASSVVIRYTPEPTAEPVNAAVVLPTPSPVMTVKKVELPEIRNVSEAGVYYNKGGMYYHVASTCKDMFSADSHTLAEAAASGKVACKNCSVVSMELLSHETEDYLWVDSKNVAHTTDVCSEFIGAYRVIPFDDVYQGHFTYCPKCHADTVYEYMRQHDAGFNVDYDNITQDEVILYEYERTIDVYYTANSRFYHANRECQQMEDEQAAHNLFEALHKDNKRPCPVCNPANEADASEYLAQFRS
ncbi:MAG: hypothetical protein II920_10745 [Clostridia bacterium]|nr:hypothetical protein [Clostridia bacterium]